MMKITPYSGNEDIEDHECLEITIKTFPYDGNHLPIFYITSPDDNYPMTIAELAGLMDGIEIAKRNIDEIINYLLRVKDE